VKNRLFNGNELSESSKELIVALIDDYAVGDMTNELSAAANRIRLASLQGLK
jgi:hypothetical protein